MQKKDLKWFTDRMGKIVICTPHRPGFEMYRGSYHIATQDDAETAYFKQSFLSYEDTAPAVVTEGQATAAPAVAFSDSPFFIK